MIYVSHDEDLALNYDWIYNVKPHAIANDISKYRRVDGALRARRQVEWNHPVYWPLFAVVGLLFLGSLPAASVVRQRRTRRLRRGDATGEATDPEIVREAAAIEYSTLSSSGSSPMRPEPPTEHHPITRAPNDQSREDQS